MTEVLEFNTKMGVKMKILITNDDGINAKGIEALAIALKNVGEIYVVAPDRERSATGHGITVHHPLRVQETNNFGDSVKSWWVDGTPADCVKVAIQGLMTDLPDLVVSGINLGSNLGTDVLYSGTVSAAIEGIIHDIPSFAISLSTDKNPDFCYATDFAKYICTEIKEQHLTIDTLLNINIPALTSTKIKGVKVTKLGTRRYKNCMEKRFDPKGRIYYWMGGEAIDINKDDGTDIAAIEQGYVSVTPIHFDLTNYKIMNEVESWNLKK